MPAAEMQKYIALGLERLMQTSGQLRQEAANAEVNIKALVFFTCACMGLRMRRFEPVVAWLSGLLLVPYTI